MVKQKQKVQIVSDVSYSYVETGHDDTEPDGASLKKWFLYLDEECTIPFEDAKVIGDVTIYATLNFTKSNYDIA